MTSNTAGRSGEYRAIAVVLVVVILVGAGVLVGLLGLAFPAALATGYGFLQMGMADGLPNTALWVVLAFPFVKILSTSLSIGSGGSGGIFGPGMVIGG